MASTTSSDAGVSSAPYAVEFLGGGRMGEALLAGLLAGGHVAVTDLAVVERDAPRRAALAARHPGLHVVEHPVAARLVVVCTKPGDVPAALSAAAAAGLERVVSIAAGVTTTSIETVLAPTLGAVPVVRAMPNTPALVGAGATAIAAGSHASDVDLDDAESLLSPVGLVIRVDESLMDAVTAVSGSGPAYVFLLAEAMIDAGTAAGLSRPDAEALVGQTLLGAARLLCEQDDDAASLRAAVTSPGGTTEAAIAVLEDRDLRGSMAAAIDAAVRRAAELDVASPSSPPAAGSVAAGGE
ncbi:MAG: pyrroline-5-carboxylate reductase [Microthrixaceae bacterium]